MVHYLILALFAGFILACYVTGSITQTAILYRQLTEGNAAAVWVVLSILVMSVFGVIVARRGRGKERMLAYDGICILMMSVLAFFQQESMDGVSNFYRAMLAMPQGAVYSFIPICVNGLMSVVFLLLGVFRKSESP